LGLRSSGADCLDTVDFPPEKDRSPALGLRDARVGSGSSFFGEFAACDLIGVALLVCDPLCCIMGANRTALALLRSGDSFLADSSGILRATRNHDLSTDALLQRMVARALDGQHTAAFVVPRSAHQPGLTVIVKDGSSCARTSCEDRPLALVLIIDPLLPPPTAAAHLQKHYGLNAAEEQLARLLLEGLSLQECCDELAISRAEGRSSLQALFKKTGVRRRKALLTLLRRELSVAQAGERAGEFVGSRAAADCPH
jgi:DNA-binding CsgD family transcriptional regulator